RGDGAGAFTDATYDAAMILDATNTAFFAGQSPRPLFGFVMCDVNDDGRLDLVGAAYGRMYNELFLADGNVFTEVGAQTLVGQDGDLDLYESNIRHPDVGSAGDPSELIVNATPAGSAGVAALAFARPGRETMGLVPPIDLATTDEGGQHDAAFDFDADGWLD